MHRMILNETSYFGAGCRESIAIEAKRRGFKKAFFVTDKDLIRFKVADKVIEVFEKNDIPYEVYSDVKANPNHCQCTEWGKGLSGFRSRLHRCTGRRFFYRYSKRDRYRSQQP